MLLFILSSDVLTRLIQKNKLIKGVQFQKEVFKISQFADDTIFAFQNENEINYINKELDTFGKISGLKINTSKTQIIITEPLLKCKIENKYPNLTITDKLKILGITFHSKEKKGHKNWLDLIPKIRSIIKKHENRNISIFGKIQIIKTLAIPLSMNIARMYRPKETIIKEISDILFKFI